MASMSIYDKKKKKKENLKCGTLKLCIWYSINALRPTKFVPVKIPSRPLLFLPKRLDWLPSAFLWDKYWKVNFYIPEGTYYVKPLVVCPVGRLSVSIFLVWLTPPTFIKGFQWNFQMWFTRMWSSVWHFLVFKNELPNQELSPLDNLKIVKIFLYR